MSKMITLLDHDVLLHSLSYLNASDLDFGVALSCKVLHQEASSPKLWKELCKQTGKLRGALVPSSDPPSSRCYFDLYHKIPCVPVDFATIHQALDVSPPGATILIMPGIYEERLVIHNSVRIRATDPRRGAAIVWYDSEDGSGHQNESVVEVDESCAYVSLQNLTLLHYSRGTDIWHGNCAVYCHGNLTHTSLDSCSIQSDSGRGVVIADGASVTLSRSTIHDCAATGLYLGDEASILDVTTSNIVRNGFGNRRYALQDEQTQDSDISVVRSGHSGLYVEGSEAEIRDTLVSENCLTGLSVVRDGTVHICQSHVVGNGEDPIVVFRDDALANDSLEGGVYEHSNHFDFGLPLRGELESTIMRCPSVPHRFLSRKLLRNHFCKKQPTA